MDDPDDVEGNPTVGSSTIQVVDSSTPTDNMDMLLPEGNAMFDATGVIMEDAALPASGDYMEPDQTDRSPYPSMHESSNNYVGSSGQSSSHPDDGSGPSQADDDIAASGQITSSSGRNGPRLHGGCNVEDSQSPQAVPEVDVSASKPSSSETDQVASSSISADETTSNTARLDAMQSQVSSGDDNVARNSAGAFSMDEESAADAVSMQDSELQVVPDSGGSILSKQPDTSTSWSGDAVTSGNSERECSAEEQVRRMYPTTSEAQMVPVSSNTLSESREADILSNSEHLSHDSDYLSRQHEVSHSELEDEAMQMADTGQVHVTSSQNQSMSEALSSTEGRFGTLEDTLNEATISEIQASHSGIHLLSHCEATQFSAAESNEVYADTPDSNKPLLVTCGEVEHDVMYPAHLSSQRDEVASSSAASRLMLPSLVSSNLNSLVEDEMEHVVFSSTDNVTNTSEATPTGDNSSVAMQPDQSVSVEISNEARCTMPSQTDETINLVGEDSGVDVVDNEVAGPSESSQLITDSGMLSDSTVHSQSQAELGFSQTNNEAAHLENDIQYLCVPATTESHMMAYLSHADEIAAEPDSGSAITEATGEDLGPCDGGTSVNVDDDEEDTACADSPEQEYTVHLQNADSGSEEITYLVQEGQEGAETFRIMTEQQLKEMQAEDTKVTAQVIGTGQELVESSLQEQSVGQQFVVQAQMEGEEVLLHLPNVVQAADTGDSVGSHIIALDGHGAQEIQIIKSIAPQLSTAIASTHMVPSSSSIVCRTDVERQTAAVLSETLPTRVVTEFQPDPSTSLLRPLTTAATVNTTSIRTPITAEVEAPSTSRQAMHSFSHQAAQTGVQQIVYQSQQEVQPEFQIMPPGTMFPQVTQPGKSLLRPLVSQTPFQSGLRVEPVIQAEMIYAEPREEIQVFNNVAYEPVPSTIQQALAVEGLLNTDEHQPQPVMLAEGDLANHLTMAMAHGEIMQDEEYETGIEIQDATAPQVIDLGNAGGSAISADNMQALLQILQALPFNTQGQTVQIVLQGSNTTTPTAPGQEVYQLSEYATPQQPQQKEQVLHLVQMMSNGSATPNKTMTDMAVQVGSREASETILSGMTAFQTSEMATVDSLRGKSSGRSGRRGGRRPVGRAPLMKHHAYSEPEDMGVDARSGVSYYAVIDYLSEQDGYSSSQDMPHHEAPSSGFMEDHLELQSDTDGFQNRSLLESTLDLTTIVSPYRRKGRYKVLAISQPGTSIDLPTLPSQASVTLQEKTYEQAKLEGKDLSEQTYDDGDPTSRPPRYTRGLRTIQQKKPNHRCGYCDYQSRDKLLVMQHCEIEHPKEPIKTVILMPKYTRRQCPYCKQEFNYAEFFQHMRYTHNEVHPYKCFYCDFQGRDRNQVKHHIRKKHGKPTKIVNLLREPHESAGFGRRRIMAMSEGEESVYEYLTDEDEDDEWDDAVDRRSLTCPECKKTFKTLKYLKTHIKMHWPHRYQCGYCDYIATLEHQILKHSIRKHGSVEPKIISKELEPEKNPLVSRNIEDIMNKVFSLSMRKPRDPDIRKWARKWACPHCDYTCQFGASFRRHIRMHANLLPYKCNYCSFKGREKYYVRRHIARMHRGLPEIVVENTAENRACDTSSDEDFQAKGLRRRRRRRAKRVLKAVVPVETKSALSEACMMIKHNTDSQPIREIIAMDSRPLKRRALEELGTLTSVDYYTPFRKNSGIENIEYSQGTPPPPKQSEWLGEKLSFYYGSREGEKASCKVCGQKIHINMFYKHARKHFKVKPFKCSYCDYKAIERAKIRVHITFKHPLLEFKIEECHVWNLSPHDVSKVFVDTCETQQWKPVDVTFTCPICQEQINGEERSLRDHLYIHYSYKPYKCTSCDMTFPSHEMAVSHLAVDHDQESETVMMNEDFPEEIESTIQQLLKEIEEAKIMEAIPHVPMKRKRGRPPKAEKTHNLFQCPICDRQLNCHTATIRRHFYSHYEYKPFQCGYCTFKATSDNEVKQHTVSHGSVPCNIVFSEETMPPKLEKMLEKFLDAICLTPRPKQLLTPASLLSGSETLLQTEEGRRWKDLLTQGMCPWCNQKIGHFRPTAYRHLKHHFDCHPFKCGHCDYKGVERLEIKQHIGESHPNCSIAIVGPTVDVKETEMGLQRFLWSKSYQRSHLSPSQKDLSEEASVGRLGDNFENDKQLETADFEQDNFTVQQSLKPLPANFRKGKPSRLIPRKESYHSDSEILEVKETGAVLLMRSFKSENEVSTDSSDSEDRQPSQRRLPVWADVDDMQIPDDFEVPQAFLQDVLYLLKISSLPHDTSMFKRKGDWHRCNQCRRRFRKYNALKQHIENDHAVEAISFFCCYCDFQHSEKGVVKTHIIDAHPGRRLLIKERLNTSRSGSTKRRREEDMACIARVYREPKRARADGEVEDAEVEEMATEGDQGNELEESVANIQHYFERIDPPLKRKRGRPRKNPIPNMSAPLIEHFTVKKEDCSEFVSGSSTQDSPKEVVVHVTVTQAYPTSRRRGRPRKCPLPVVTADVLNVSSDGFQLKERQPPSNIQTLTNGIAQIVSPSDDAPLTPRKRGRPRKHPLPNTEDAAEEISKMHNTVLDDSRPQFVVVDKCGEPVLESERTDDRESEKSAAEAASSVIQDVVAVLESKDTSAAEQGSDADFEELVLQLASDSAGEYSYKVCTKAGVEQETIRIFGSPPRIVRQKMSEAGEEEEEVLVAEDLEDLEECNENLPKILKMLRLRPSK